MSIEYIYTPIEIVKLRIKSTVKRDILSLVLSFGDKGMLMSNAQIAEILNTSKRNVYVSVRDLIKCGYINRIEQDYSYRKLVINFENLPIETQKTGDSNFPEGTDNFPKTENSNFTKKNNNFTPVYSNFHEMNSNFTHNLNNLKNLNNLVVEENTTTKNISTFSDFSEPSVQQVRDYANEIGFETLDAEYFVNYYRSKDWFVGKSKMKNWKASVSIWKHRESKENSNLMNTPTSYFNGSKYAPRAPERTHVVPTDQKARKQYLEMINNPQPKSVLGIG